MASWTGRGPVWTRSACAPSGGLPDRPEPDRSRQARIQVPPAGRPQRHPLGGVPVGREHPRLAAAEAVVDAIRPVKGPRGRPGRPPRGRPSSMATRGTTTHAAGGRSERAGSPRGSPGVASSPASGWAATGMWWSGRWRGWLVDLLVAVWVRSESCPEAGWWRGRRPTRTPDLA
jgi:hypothetical protein